MRGLRGGTKRPKSLRPTAVYDVLRNEQGFTTVGAAVAILLTCSLLFFGVWSARSASRAASVQATADAAALAAENEVAEFVIAVRVADASLFSMSLAGITLLGAGVACCLVPSAQATGAKLIDAGKAVIDKREEVARTEEKALNLMQDALPLTAQAQAQAVLAENSDASNVSAVGYVELVPSDAPEVSCGTSEKAMQAADAVVDESEQLQEVAREAEEAAGAADEAFREGWLADCGAEPSGCMSERARTLAGLSGTSNPIAKSSNTWSYGMALERARAYYKARVAQEAPENDSVEEQARSALRKRFYEYAVEQLKSAHAIDDGRNAPDISLPTFPRNRAQMQQTTLYTDAVYAVSNGSLHAWDGCPGIGSIEGRGCLAQMDAGAYTRCDVCGFDAVAMGSVASASTNIDNGFEHYWRRLVESADTYVEAKKRAIEASSLAKQEASSLFDLIQEALDEVAGNRVEAYPPGRYGAIVAMTAGIEDEHVGGSFVGTSDLGSFAAISAATMAEDDGENLIEGLLDGVNEEMLPIVATGGDFAVSLWASLLSAYDGSVETVRGALGGALDVIPLVSASGLGTWAQGKFDDVLADMGLEPVNTASPKPMLVNTQHVAAKGTGPVARAVETVKDVGS